MAKLQSFQVLTIPDKDSTLPQEYDFHLRSKVLQPTALSLREVWQRSPEEALGLLTRYYPQFVKCFAISNTEVESLESLTRRLATPELLQDVILFMVGDEAKGGVHYRTFDSPDDRYGFLEYIWAPGFGAHALKVFEERVAALGCGAIVAETINPAKLSVEEIRKLECSGDRPWGRIFFWARAGYSEVGVPYVDTAFGNDTSQPIPQDLSLIIKYLDPELTVRDHISRAHYLSLVLNIYNAPRIGAETLRRLRWVLNSAEPGDSYALRELPTRALKE